MFGNITSANIATVHEDVNSEDKHLIYYAAKKVRTSILKDGKGIEIGDKMKDMDIE